MTLSDFLPTRKKAYQYAFSYTSGHGRLLLDDLARFCRANETCVVIGADGHVDKERSLILEGRREVWLRIQQHIHLDDAQLMQIFGGLPK